MGASPYDKEAFSELYEHNFKDALNGLTCFYCRGAWDLEGMHFVDKSLCKMLLKSVAKQDPATCEPWQKALMEAGTQKCDWTNRKYIDPILEYIVK